MKVLCIDCMSELSFKCNACGYEYEETDPELDSRQHALQELKYFMIDEKGSWFNAKLFSLIMKADLSNLRRLSAGYPEYVKIVNEWRKKGDDIFEELNNESA